MKILLICTLLFSLFSCQKEKKASPKTIPAATASKGPPTLRVVTEEFPPYSYTENGVIKGISTVVIRRVLKELNMKIEIESLPWSRALSTAQNNENVLIYSIGRNKTRENKFKWIGIIAPVKYYLFAKANRKDINIKTLKDAKKYTIATSINGVREQYFKTKGFAVGKHLDSVSKAIQGLKMLEKGRVDLWSSNELTGYSLIEKLGFNKEDFKLAYFIKGLPSEGYHMAFGTKTSDEMVEKFKAALKKVK
jgi:polar amino acid transport system substrate-binding protein